MLFDHPVHFNALLPMLETTWGFRSDLVEHSPHGAARLFNGFVEGWPGLVIELYDDTLVIMNHAHPSEAPNDTEALQIVDFYRAQIPNLRCAILKNRYAENPSRRRGIILWGSKPAQKVQEHGVWYALDLTFHQDTTLYLDTRNLRQWAIQNLTGKRVLNAFAYTGSLGVAAMAGGAAQVVHVDLNRIFLNLAKTSYTLNGFSIRKENFRRGDFYPLASALKRKGELFDCVFLDPPFFSLTNRGQVDLVSKGDRLINKVRPLIAHEGWLVAINNALFVSGADHLHTLERLCAEGYLSIEAIIPVPDDCAGYPQTRLRPLPSDPAPYNHATKITILRVRRKDGRLSSTS